MNNYAKKICDNLKVTPALTQMIEELEAKILVLPGVTTLVSSFLIEIEVNFEVALKNLKDNTSKKTYGKNLTWGLYFYIALRQIPNAQLRHKRNHIPQEISDNTLSDIFIRLQASNSRDNIFGISYDAFKWMQNYLTQDLLKLNSIQYQVRRFQRPFKLFKSQNQIQILKGKDTPSKGKVIVNSNSYILRIHFPHNADLKSLDLIKEIRYAFKFFAELYPQKKLAGLYGDAWFLDENILKVIKNTQLTTLIKKGFILPSEISELNTLRRVFNYNANRESIKNLKNENLNNIQLIIKTLIDNNIELKARAVFGSNEELKSLKIL